MKNAAQLKKIATAPGFIAALDQSGGSTPKALALYGIETDAFSNDDEMFGLIHQMRIRIIQSPAFDGNRVIGAILFENTMERDIEGTPSADYLWNELGVVPFLKVDKGLEDITNQSQMLKPMPNLDNLLKRAVEKNIFGTKMRSVIHGANETGVISVVKQQFEIGKQILSHGLIPIIEPEVTIMIADKSLAEDMLRDAILAELDTLSPDQKVMLKLTLPETPNQYLPLITHPNVLRVVALSGGYSQEVANSRLSANKQMIASFSRALAEGLNASQSDEIFNGHLDTTIQGIFNASMAG